MTRKYIIAIQESKYPFTTNLSKDRQKSRSYKAFIKKVDSFYNSILPKMDLKMQMYLDISELVGKGIEATLYIWGWNLLCDDELEFDRLYNKTDMERQVGSIVKAAIGNYSNIYVSTYWKSKLNIKNKSQEVGPYVAITFSSEDMLLEGKSYDLKDYDLTGTYTMYKGSTGYNITCPDPRFDSKDRNLYVSKVKKDGTYEYSMDHLYAKDFSKATAEKHLAILNKKG